MKRFLCFLAIVAAAMSDSNLEKIFKTSNDQFSAKMFQEVVNEQKDQNYVLSAFSVLSPLAQLALASVGETHDQILKTIGFPNDNVTKEVFLDMNAKMRSVQGVDLEMANKLYVSESYPLNYQFAASEKEIFNSEIENINFQNRDEAADEINKWVEDHTHKRITKVIEPNYLDEGTITILINALYFKGSWMKRFDKTSTKKYTFHRTKELTKSVPMMFQCEHFNFANNAEFDAKFLEMEYEGGEASFVVALPNKIDGINSLIEKFKDPSSLDKALRSMSSNKVNVYLPKFKIESTTDLTNVLNKMGIINLFEEGLANLNKLLEKDYTTVLFVSDATQKAFIEVNEEGAEATAVNTFRSFGIKPMMRLNEIIQEFKADHPFLFFVMVKNNVLFSGVYRS